MNKTLLTILFIPLLIIINSCGNKPKEIINSNEALTSESLYQAAVLELKKKQ